VFRVTTPTHLPTDDSLEAVAVSRQEMEIGAMTEQTTSDYGLDGRGATTSGWARGFVVFAGLMMIMAGAFQALTGLVALFENAFYVATRNYLPA
jgi:hypothetical protein